MQHEVWKKRLFNSRRNYFAHSGTEEARLYATTAPCVVQAGGEEGVFDLPLTALYTPWCRFTAFLGIVLKGYTILDLAGPVTLT